MPEQTLETALLLAAHPRLCRHDLTSVDRAANARGEDAVVQRRS
jgi:hypothetical protein